MAYKVFQNGFPLPASDLNNYLMNQSVITFANSTARSAAIASPVEGMLTYLEDTNSYEGWNGSAWTDINDNTSAIPKSTVTTAGDLIVATGSAAVTRLGAGAAGRVLTSSGSSLSWEVPTSGGITLLATTALSGSSTTISSIDQGYQKLLLIYNMTSTSATQFRIRPNNASPVNIRIRGTSVTNSSDGTLSTETSTNYQGFYEIMNYAATDIKKSGHYGFITGASDSSGGFSMTTSNSAVTSIVITPVAGTLSGEVLTYGVK